jgi:hypothetical protein
MDECREIRNEFSDDVSLTLTLLPLWVSENCRHLIYVRVYVTQWQLYLSIVMFVLILLPVLNNSPPPQRYLKMDLCWVIINRPSLSLWLNLLTYFIYVWITVESVDTVVLIVSSLLLIMICTQHWWNDKWRKKSKVPWEKPSVEPHL